MIIIRCERWIHDQNGIEGEVVSYDKLSEI